VDPAPTTFRFEGGHMGDPEATNPGKGDQVTFDLTMDRRSLRRCARNIIVVKAAVKSPEDGGECRGLVHSVVTERHFGFVIREDTNAKVFFHLTAFQKESGSGTPERGDSVKFTLSERNGKHIAVNVGLLPRGTVQMEEEEPGRRLGVIAMQPVVADEQLTDGKIVLLEDATSPGDDGIGRVLPFTLADQGEAAEAGKTGAAEENASSASADPETFCVGQCVTFTLFSNRLKRSLKRAGRVSLSGQPLFATAKGTVVDVQGAAGSIRPVAASAEAGTGGVATALKEVPFAATEALDPVRAGDEVSYIVVLSSKDSTETARAVAVAQSFSLRFAGGPRVNRQQSVNKFQYREAKRPEKNSLGFEEGWRERLRAELAAERVVAQHAESTEQDAALNDE
jgi:cold shock CspA family protein